MTADKLLISPTCGWCAKAKEHLKEDIDSGKIELVNILEDGEALELARTFGGTPTLVREQDGKTCEVDITSGEVRKCLDNDQQE